MNPLDSLSDEERIAKYRLSQTYSLYIGFVEDLQRTTHRLYAIEDKFDEFISPDEGLFERNM